MHSNRWATEQELYDLLGEARARDAEDKASKLEIAHWVSRHLPREPPVLTRLVELYIECGESEAALHWARSFIEEHPDEGDAQFCLVNALELSGEFELAEAAYTKATRDWSPVEVWWARRRGRLLAKAGKHQEAVAWLERALAVESGPDEDELERTYRGEVLVDLVESLLELGRIPAARATVERELRRRPTRLGFLAASKVFLAEGDQEQLRAALEMSQYFDADGLYEDEDEMYRFATHGEAPVRGKHDLYDWVGLVMLVLSLEIVVMFLLAPFWSVAADAATVLRWALVPAVLGYTLARLRPKVHDPFAILLSRVDSVYDRVSWTPGRH